MAIFAVHCATDEPDAAAAFARARFVKLGFSWGAFLLGPVWLIAHWLWRPLALFILGAALIGFAMALGVLGVGAAICLYGVCVFYLGFEGRAFLGAALTRRGRPLADVVCAADITAAEAGFFSRAPAQTAPRAAPPPAGPPRSSPPQILGLFPEAGR